MVIYRIITLFLLVALISPASASDIPENISHNPVYVKHRSTHEGVRIIDIAGSHTRLTYSLAQRLLIKKETPQHEFTYVRGQNGAIHSVLLNNGKSYQVNRDRLGRAVLFYGLNGVEMKIGYSGNEEHPKEILLVDSNTLLPSPGLQRRLSAKAPWRNIGPKSARARLDEQLADQYESAATRNDGMPQPEQRVTDYLSTFVKNRPQICDHPAGMTTTQAT